MRSNLSGKEPAYLWQLYLLLVEIEGVFKSFKNELEIRPVYHSVGSRVEAHIFVCFLAYCLHVTLRQELRGKAPGLTPRAVLEKLATVQMLNQANIESWVNLGKAGIGGIHHVRENVVLPTPTTHAPSRHGIGLVAVAHQR